KKVKKIITELTITPLITDYGARHTYGSVKVQEGVVLNLLLLRNLNYLLQEKRITSFYYNKKR
ncbi:hypothetical protein LZU46_10010, partial [Streptococcus agalactiae]|nr:hypothetical protein [Streptococcus agalactiae]MCK6273642.1 hypothetical protein [Streptococcus agalactiae]